MAFLQSHPPRQPIFRAPPVVLGLIGILAAAHLVRVNMPGVLADAIVTQFAFFPERYGHAFLASRQPIWASAIPFLSYMALHASWTHLVINCLWLLAFGPIVARRFGSVLFLAFFLVCGVAGALTYLAFNWASPDPVIGASGAIAGLMAAGMRMLPGQAPWAHPGEAPLAPVFSRQILMFTGLWTAINLLTAFTGLGMGGESGLIAWQAHLGGFAAGLLLSGPFDRLRPRVVGAPLDS